MTWDATTNYSARFELPDDLEATRDNAVGCPVYASGELVAPASGVVSLFNASGVAVVDGAVVTITDDVATYTVPSAALAGQSKGDNWRLEWVLTFTGSVVRTFDNEANLVRRKLFPVASEVDLYRRCSAIDPTSTNSITTGVDHADKLAEAWVVIMSRLIGLGQRPNLILSPTALRDSHTELTLALIFEDLAARNGDAYADRGAEYRARYHAAWDAIRFKWDETDDDGKTANTTRRAAVSTLWLGSGR